MAKAYLGNEPYIFISYSHKDDILVHPFIEQLQATGCRVWFDEGLHIGANFFTQIAEKLDNSSCVIVMLSNNSLQSEWVYNEIYSAKEGYKPIYPIFLEDISLPTKFLLLLGGIQGIKIKQGINEKLIPTLPNNVFGKNATIKPQPIIQEQTMIDTLNNFDDKKAKQTFINTTLKDGAVLRNYKNHLLLNEYFKQELNAFMSSRWVVPWDNKTIVWMVGMTDMTKGGGDGGKAGWKNYYYGTHIIENIEDRPDPKKFAGIPVLDFARMHPYRIAVEKRKGKKGNDFIVHGLYKFSEEKSSDNQHYYEKI